MKHDLTIHEETNELKKIAEYFGENTTEFKIIQTAALAYVFAKEFYEIEFHQFLSDNNKNDIKTIVGTQHL
jgi:hypothetical protein